jgi:hypothetical protein
MDDHPDEFAELEAELKALHPAAPSPALRARLATELDSNRPAKPWWFLGTLPVAAAITAGIFLSQRNLPAVPDQMTTVATFQPVAAENVLYATKDEGYVTLEDGTPARRLRSNYVDTITWKNPRSNASLRWTVPREEVRVVPVSFQ